MSPALAPLRPFWLLMPLGLLYMASFCRLVQLQAFPAEGRRESALSRTLTEQAMNAPRGRLLDREGRVLAEDRPRWRLVVDARPDTREIPSLEELAPLADLLDLPAVRVLEACEDRSRFRSVIAGGLSPETARRLLLRLRAPTPQGGALTSAGLRLEHYWQRVRPQGRSLEHAIGYVHEQRVEVDGRAKLVRRGVEGLERFCDPVLQSTPGHSRSRLALAGHGVNPALSVVPGRPGADVHTTLDACIGHIAQEELAALGAEWTPDWAVAVVLEPHTGEVLCLASWPDYDPVRGPASDEISNLDLHALTYLVEPGSTVKPFVVSLALAAGAVGPREIIDCGPGVWFHGRRRIQDTHANGPQTPRGILVRSSNIGAARVGLRLGAERLREGLLAFGLTEPLHFMRNEPTQGRLPSRDGPDGFRNPYTVPSVSFGHQWRVSPVRLVASFAALVNGGRLLPASLLRDVPPGSAPRRVLPSWAAEYVKEAMAGVVEEGPPGLPARKGFRWGGKSGTTRKTHTRGYTSSFIGFAPVEDPDLLVGVVVENPVRKPYVESPYGRLVAGPAVGRILQRSLVLRGRLPSE